MSTPFVGYVVSFIEMFAPVVSASLTCAEKSMTPVCVIDFVKVKDDGAQLNAAAVMVTVDTLLSELP